MLAAFRPLCSRILLRRPFSLEATRQLSQNEYERVSEDTLEHLYDYLDQLPEHVNAAPEYDVSYSMGVLTACVSKAVGTYVINKQSPNRQIWLSSPFSGPKRYDFVGNRWIYSHDGVSLHKLLQTEFEEVFKKDGDKIRIADLENLINN